MLSPPDPYTREYAGKDCGSRAFGSSTSPALSKSRSTIKFGFLHYAPGNVRETLSCGGGDEEHAGLLSSRL
jgi:hypothetical protein